MSDLTNKTVIELRKIAKEQGVILGAGISKAGIIAKLEAAMGAVAVQTPSEAPVATLIRASEQPAPQPAAPAEEPKPAPVEPPKPAEGAVQQQFRAAWHNPTPRYGAKPAYQAPAHQPRQGGYNRPAPQMDSQRQAPVRPAGYTPRFGPAAQEPVADAPQRPEEEYRTFRQDAPARSYSEPRRSYGEPQRPPVEQPRYDARPAYEDRPRSYDAPAYPRQPRQDYGVPRQDYGQPRPDYGAPRSDAGFFAEPSVNPGVNEILAAGDCADGAGLLEMHPDGYGFLRSAGMLPSSRDIYVSMAQIRRFSLRTGDYVEGKTRPQRDGDKYAAMLYITSVNGMNPDELPSRPHFDELTPEYPRRRINLESADEALSGMRLIDLIAPLGFGQRALALFPPETGKTELLIDFANVITRNHPEATVMVLLVEKNPEDVTDFRSQVSCSVVASTFDQPPEQHLRLADMVQARAERLVEQGKDVILIVDSLTQLSKVYTSAQQNRTLPTTINPTSLFRTKKLFGAARCMKEGGSLTIIGAMNVESGSKVDDAVVEEFKGTANMELLLDASVARAGVRPAINLTMSGTKRAEALLDSAQAEGLQIIRSIMTSTRSVTAIPQLMSMLEMAPTNEELLLKIKDWAQLMTK